MSRRRAYRTVAAYAILTVALVLPAYWRVFHGFARIDDEGYLLSTLRAFVAGRDLYSDVFTQYGPFYYELFGGFYALTDRPIGLDSGRFITLVLWLGAAVLAGAAAHRLTGRLWVGLATMLVAYRVLYAIAANPMHPIGLSAFLLAVAAAVVAFVVPRRPAAGMAIAGAVGAALALTKLNAGGYALIALALAWALLARGGGAVAILRWAIVAAALVLTPALMGPDLGESWAQLYALVVVCGVVALVVSRYDAPVPDAPAGLRLLGALVAGAAAATVAILLVIVATGAPAGDVLNTVFVEPTRQREVLTYPLNLPAWLVAFAFGGVGAAFAHRALRPAGGPGPLVSGSARVLAGVIIWAGPTGDVLDLGFIPSDAIGLSVVLAWIAAVPPGILRAGARDLLARNAICAMAILATLQSYPVAGTQNGPAVVLLTLVGGLVIADGLRQLELATTERADAATGAARARVLAAAAALVLVGSFVFEFALRDGTAGERSFSDSRALPFPTANRVRLGEDAVRIYEGIVATLRDRCARSFYTWPGMNTFYEWAEAEPPTGLQPTVWTRLLDDEQQRRVVTALRDRSVPCVLHNGGIQGDWDKHGEAREGPLTDYISASYRADADLGGGYRLLVRNGP